MAEDYDYLDWFRQLTRFIASELPKRPTCDDPLHEEGGSWRSVANIQLNDLRKANEALRHERDQLQQRLDTYVDAEARLTKELDEARTTLASQQSSWEATLAREAAGWKERVLETEAISRANRNALEEAERRSRANRQELEQFRRAHRDAEASVAALEAEQAQALRTIDRLTTDRNQWAASNQRHKERHHELADQLDAVCKHVERAMAESSDWWEWNSDTWFEELTKILGMQDEDKPKPVGKVGCQYPECDNERLLTMVAGQVIPVNPEDGWAVELTGGDLLWTCPNHEGEPNVAGPGLSGPPPKRAMSTYPRDVQVVWGLLSLVQEEFPADMPSLETIAGWNSLQREGVQDWASAVHLRASDNDVEIPEMPLVLKQVRKVQPDA